MLLNVVDPFKKEKNGNTTKDIFQPAMMAIVVFII
jgi:hypothetical protein